jgi:hypothetical protein
MAVEHLTASFAATATTRASAVAAACNATAVWTLAAAAFASSSFEAKSFHTARIVSIRADYGSSADSCWILGEPEEVPSFADTRGSQNQRYQDAWEPYSAPSRQEAEEG